MKDRNQLILNQRRDFGDVIGDGLKFMKINFKPMFTVFLTYVVPVFLIPLVLILFMGYLPIFLGAFSINPGDTIDPSTVMGSMIGILMGMLVFMVFVVIAYMIINLTVYGAFLAYEDNGNEVVTVDQIKGYIKSKFGNYLISLLILLPILIGVYILTFVMAMVGAVLGVFAVLVTFTVLGCGFLWFFISIINFSWIRVKEEVDIGEGFRRAFYLTKQNWWSTFGVLFVAGIVTTIASYAFSIPFHTALGFADISGFDSGGSSTTMIIIAGFGFLIYMLGSTYVQQFSSVCIIMKYYDQVEMKDGSSIAAQIDELGESNDSFFENEGEY